jgi:hypothetical protein
MTTTIEIIQGGSYNITYVGAFADLANLPAYSSHELALAALGSNRLFRYLQGNYDGVISLNNSAIGIT